VHIFDQSRRSRLRESTQADLPGASSISSSQLLAASALAGGPAPSPPLSAESARGRTPRARLRSVFASQRRPSASAGKAQRARLCYVLPLVAARAQARANAACTSSTRPRRSRLRESARADPACASSFRPRRSKRRETARADPACASSFRPRRSKRRETARATPRARPLPVLAARSCASPRGRNPADASSFRPRRLEPCELARERLDECWVVHDL